MTMQQAQQQLATQLKAIYEAREASAIADRVMEHLTGLSKIDRLIDKTAELTTEEEALLAGYTAQLMQQKPVQYVLQEAWFFDMPLYVNEHVLIPRPETEELVEWVAADLRRQHASPLALDIGTGSGCIAIALKKKWPAINMSACDVSDSALEVARRNASAEGVSIHFLSLDFLDPQAWSALPAYDVIVSNPPYIPKQDMAGMHPNVLAWEPHQALFVEDDDALLFYRAMAQFAQTHLAHGGSVYVEIHEALGKNVTDLFTSNGIAHVELRKDLHGKDRMVKAVK